MKRWSAKVLAGLLLATAAGAVRAQAINVDFGMDAGVPPDAYAGAALQAGHWNVIVGNETGPFALADVSGAPTSVTILLSLPFGQVSWSGPFTLDAVNASLLNDALGLHSSPCDLEIDGLAPGRYALYTYAWNGASPAIKTLVSVEGKDGQEIGGQWFGAPREGFQYALHRVHVGNDGALHVLLRGVPQSGVLNGLQLVPMKS